MLAARLHEAIAAVAPIDGVGGKQGSIRIDFKASATQNQKDAAAAVVASFDYSQEADAAWQAAKVQNKTGLIQAATNAITNNDTYVALTSPSNAQVAAQVKALTQQVTRLIKLAQENN